MFVARFKDTELTKNSCQMVVNCATLIFLFIIVSTYYLWVISPHAYCTLPNSFNSYFVVLIVMDFSWNERIPYVAKFFESFPTSTVSFGPHKLLIVKKEPSLVLPLFRDKYGLKLKKRWYLQVWNTLPDMT